MDENENAVEHLKIEFNFGKDATLEHETLHQHLERDPSDDFMEINVEGDSTPNYALEYVNQSHSDMES